MGTWGTGPFDSDGAEDLLDELAGHTIERRLEVVTRLLVSAIDAGGGADASVQPEEVVATAAVVAAGVPAGRHLPWNDDWDGLERWLPQPISADLAALAVRALEVAVPAGGWFWRSWVDAGEQEEARAAINEIKAVLATVSDGG
ncbi:DUF4259 domain-containing protein [Actinokineospora soli]|uniref:DUF4259 domain-containing protein n=1 Tax=Actinokineospora soli TaxID=1048753 RepID=A0ABW2TW99_9PSEU